MLGLLQAEIEGDMKLMGCTSISEFSRDNLGSGSGSALPIPAAATRSGSTAAVLPDSRRRAAPQRNVAMGHLQPSALDRLK